MAAAFGKAGFTAVDVHMSDLIAGRVSLEAFRGFAACGGFSYGDVLGADGAGPRRSSSAPLLRDSSPHSSRARQLQPGRVQRLPDAGAAQGLVPGADHWPRFLRNRSEQFEARLSLVEVSESPSLFLPAWPARASRSSCRTARPRAFDAPATWSPRRCRCASSTARPHRRAYPLNPNGSPAGIAGLTSADGRSTLLMPHPERGHRSVQLSWHPAEWGEDSPWMQMFYNARAGSLRADLSRCVR
jgi:phosphoribosylformylglycinamidine synthase